MAMMQTERSLRPDSSHRAYQGSKIPCQLRSRARFSACSSPPCSPSLLTSRNSVLQSISHFETTLEKYRKRWGEKLLSEASLTMPPFVSARTCTARKTASAGLPASWLYHGKKQRALTAAGQHPKGQCNVWLANGSNTTTVITVSQINALVHGYYSLTIARERVYVRLTLRLSKLKNCRLRS